MMRISTLGAGALLLAAVVSTPLTAQDRAHGLLHPNTATEAQLRGVPDLAPAVPTILAKRPFASQAAFHAVVSAALDSAKTVEAYRHVFVPINPTTATDAEILTIPGVGRRMLREFKEYRPWKSVVQFRREIGKYVDEKEVARLEQYIKIDG